MKIVGLTTSVVALPTIEPLANAPVDCLVQRVVVTAHLRTSDGIEGVGYTYFGSAISKALRVTVHQLGELIVGDNPLEIDRIVKKLTLKAGSAGPGGMFTLALSAIEIALWDIKGKAEGQPLWRLLGGDGSPVPTYASGAMMRELDLDATLASAHRLVEDGFKAAKFQLALPGSTDRKKEFERARLIREAVGEKTELMCDVNQRWDFDLAMEMGRNLETLRLTWFEDPVDHQDHRGLADLAAELETPIAAGEYVYGIWPFRHLIRQKSIDVVMIDPFRAGGIGAWLEIAKLADEFELPVVSHLAPEIQVHLVGAISNGKTVEYMPWFNELFEEVPLPVDGYLEMPKTPGLGLRFNEKTLQRYTLEKSPG